MPIIINNEILITEKYWELCTERFTCVISLILHNYRRIINPSKYCHCLRFVDCLSNLSKIKLLVDSRVETPDNSTPFRCPTLPPADASVLFQLSWRLEACIFDNWLRFQDEAIGTVKTLLAHVELWLIRTVLYPPGLLHQLYSYNQLSKQCQTFATTTDAWIHYEIISSPLLLASSPCLRVLPPNRNQTVM